MRTIAVTIDEPTLADLDRLVSSKKAKAKSRSAVVRAALAAYLSGLRRTQQEEVERVALSAHRKKLDRQLEALLGEQAEP